MERNLFSIGMLYREDSGGGGASVNASDDKIGLDIDTARNEYTNIKKCATDLETELILWIEEFEKLLSCISGEANAALSDFKSVIEKDIVTHYGQILTDLSDSLSDYATYIENISK